jgi:predicted aldo/keto reductase-like oxidoreductase
MSDDKRETISRRGFVRGASAAALGASVGSVPAAETPGETDGAELPRRVLGKTGLEVTCMTLGTAPCGIAKTIEPDGVARVVNYALDLGINYVDTSPKYGNAEEGVGLALGRRRQKILLATKVMTDSVAEAEAILAKSLGTLDVLYFHHLGDRDVERAREPDGVFTWLLAQKKAGKCRFVGISGHNLPGRFPAFLETGDVDVILVTVNFADRHTYNFEEKVLPIARKHNVGIFAMKVFGGPDPETGSWGNPEAKPYVGQDRVELAIRYALSTPGVTAANLGVHTREQVRRNVEIVKRFRQLSPHEQKTLAGVGRKLAGKWKDHFGPVT